jgi:hypothetical protein
LFGVGQGCASPVPPFAGEVKRFPDEPGARPLTCQLSAQIIDPPRAGATGCPGAGWGTSAARQTVEPEASRQEGREAVGLPHTSCPVCRLNRPFPACIRFAAVRCWLVTAATLERTANEVCVSAPLLCSGGVLRPSRSWRARLDVSPKRAEPDHEQTAKCALTTCCANPVRRPMVGRSKGALIRRCATCAPRPAVEVRKRACRPWGHGDNAARFRAS